MANSPLRVCEARYGEFHMHYRGIRRFIWRDTNPWAGSGDQAQVGACADDGARALPSAPTQTGAPGQKADRASNLPESPVDAEARLAASVADKRGRSIAGTCAPVCRIRTLNSRRIRFGRR